MHKSYQTDDCLELLGSVTENNDTYMFTFLQSNHVGSTPPELTMIRPITVKHMNELFVSTT